MNRTRRGESGRAGSAGGILLGVLWMVIGLGIGWAVGDLVDRLAAPTHELLVEATLGLCALVLIGWAYGTRLLYLEVRAGVDAATQGTTRLRGRGWISAYAAPIVGVWMAISSATGPGRVLHDGRPALVEPARGHATQRREGEVPNLGRTRTIIVSAGDTLPDLAERFLGSPDAWPIIARANAGRLHEPSGARLVDPSRLPVGLTLVVPITSEAAPPPPPAVATADPFPREPSIYAALAGFGLLGAASFAHRQRRRRELQSMRASAGDRPPKLSAADASVESALRRLDATELPRWIDATSRFLATQLDRQPNLEPRIWLMTAGTRGIDLLLDAPETRPPEGFIALDSGRTWRLDPALELDEVRARTDAMSQSVLTALVPVGEDETASYLVNCGPGEWLGLVGNDETTARVLAAAVLHLRNAPWSEVEIYRLGPTDFPGCETVPEVRVEQLVALCETTRRGPLWRRGIPDRQPVVLFQDPSCGAIARAAVSPIVALIGPGSGADRILEFDGGVVSIEPFGLRVPAAVPAVDELATARRLVKAASATSMQPTARRTAKITADLPTAAAIEIRLLRSSPDLIGDVDHGREVDVAVISLLGYLALHDGSAPIEQLRSVFGARRRSSAFAERALIAAIDRTRRRLGVERIPHGWGTDGCRLPASVSCDWSRFSALAATANACDEAALAERGRDARAMALELVEGPPCETVRDLLPWLDDEQIIGEMVAEIVAVAHDLVLSEIAEGTVAALDRADWALRQGRRVAPDHAALVEAAMFLADARGDDAAMTDEFESALEAVDRLELGEEISPRLETVFATLRRDRPR